MKLLGMQGILAEAREMDVLVLAAADHAGVELSEVEKRLCCAVGVVAKLDKLVDVGLVQRRGRVRQDVRLRPGDYLAALVEDRFVVQPGTGWSGVIQ